MVVASRKIIKRGARIRVLVVDDSVVIRRLVTTALEQEPQLEIVGTAPNGAAGLARVLQLAPDVITLDIEMPEMSGLEMLRELRRTNKDVRVIMFSTLTERGASSTMEALTLGADDYVTKASNCGALDRSMEALRGELIPKIKQFFTMEGEAPRAAPRRAPAAKALPVTWTMRPQVVAIGVSTGGPTALGEILPQLPAEFPLPVLIVQHMPSLFTRLLSERLQTSAKVKVVEASAGMEVQPGCVYIALGDYHMRLQKSGGKTIVTLDQGPRENSCRPSVDVMFRAAEEIYGGAVISVMLTGMGYDGLRGAYLIAQDEPSSVVWGMPGSVASTGLADAVLPLRDVVPEILRRTAFLKGGKD